MTPEEYERFKAAEKEHLKKLKELKRAVQVLDRQRKIQSALNDISQASTDALETQADMVERLAMETAEQEARLEIALDSAAEQAKAVPDEALEEELRQARARALVEKMKDSDLRVDAEGNLKEAHPRSQPAGPRGGHANPTSTQTQQAGKTTEPAKKGPQQTASGVPPAKDPRPEKTIGRM